MCLCVIRFESRENFACIYIYVLRRELVKDLSLGLGIGILLVSVLELQVWVSDYLVSTTTLTVTVSRNILHVYHGMVWCLFAILVYCEQCNDAENILHNYARDIVTVSLV